MTAPAPRDAEIRALLRHEYRESARAARGHGFTVPFGIAVIALAFAPAIPGVGAFAGFDVRASAPAFLGMLAIHLVLVVLERRGSRWYLPIDALETVYHVAAYGFLIVSSGRALSVPWFFLSMNAQLAPLHPWRWVHRGAYMAMPLIVALIFERRGQRDDALLSIVLGIGALIILRVTTDATFERVRSRLRISELERQLERSRIAMELHDGIGADLTAVVLRARAAAQGTSGIERETLDALVARARATLAELRSVVWAMRAPSVSTAALLEQVRTRAAELVPSPLQCTFDAALPEHDALPGALSVLVLRLVQEAVNNAARHANASAVDVRIRHEDGSLLLEIADDGTFRTNETPGNGLVNLRHRVEQAGGVFDIDVTTRGTVVRAHLPWPSVEERKNDTA